MQQLVVRREHRQARHVEVHGQARGSRAPAGPGGAAVEDGAPEPFVDLPVDRDAGGAVEGEVQSGHGDNIRNDVVARAGSRTSARAASIARWHRDGSDRRMRVRRLLVACSLAPAAGAGRLPLSRPSDETANATSTSRSAPGRPTCAACVHPSPARTSGSSTRARPSCARSGTAAPIWWSSTSAGAGRTSRGAESPSLQSRSPASGASTSPTARSGTLSTPSIGEFKGRPRRVLLPGVARRPRDPGALRHLARHRRFVPLRAGLLGRWRQDLGGELDRD